jgi:hypothetical protein
MLTWLFNQDEIKLHINFSKLEAHLNVNSNSFKKFSKKKKLNLLVLILVCQHLQLFFNGYNHDKT